MNTMQQKKQQSIFVVKRVYQNIFHSTFRKEIKMAREFEKVNEPLVDKLERAAKSYDAGRIQCDHPHQVASQLRENADRIRKRHAEKVKL
jgi:hypothetical protein